MKMKLTKEQNQLALLGLLMGVLVLYVLVVLVIGPLRREGQQAKLALPTARERVRALEFGTMNEEALREQLRQIEQSVGVLRAVLPPEEDLSSTIETLSAMANKADVKIQTIFPVRSVKAPDKGLEKEAPEPTVLKETLIQIDAIAGFHQLGAFVSAFEGSAKPIRLSSLRIAANPNEIKRHNAKLVIRAYFIPAAGSP